MAEVKTSPVAALNLQNWDDFRDPDRPAVGKVPGSFRFTEPDSDREQSFHYCCPCGCGRTAPELLMLRAFLIPSVTMVLIVVSGCDPSGPTEADMAGCAVRSGEPPISTREVADCAVNRAEIKRWRETTVP